MSLNLARMETEGQEDIGRTLKMAEMGIKATDKALSMHAQ